MDWLQIAWMIGSAAMSLGIPSYLLNQKRVNVGRALAYTAGGLLVFALVMSFRIVPTSSVGVGNNFGVLDSDYDEPGLTFDWPWKSMDLVNDQRRITEVTTTAVGGAQGSSSLTADEVALDVHYVQPFRINKVLAPRILDRIGRDQQVAVLLNSSAASALRDVLAKLSWRSAAIEDREQFEHKLLQRVQQIVSNDLLAQGFTKEEAESTFFFANPLIKQISPPDRIRQQIEKGKAYSEELAYQKTLDEIATSIKQRSTTEGEALANFIGKLPADRPLHEVAALLRGRAATDEARALLNAVESRQLTGVVFGGGQFGGGGQQPTPTAPAAAPQ